MDLIGLQSKIKILEMNQQLFIPIDSIHSKSVQDVQTEAKISEEPAVDA